VLSATGLESPQRAARTQLFIHGFTAWRQSSERQWHPQEGTWCSGITSASHAEGPGFNPQCVQIRICISLQTRRCGKGNVRQERIELPTLGL
jgi:hypothetical protein